MLKSISISKFEEPHINEDAVVARDGLFAIADGAGGYGIFSDKWSQYLVTHLPEEKIKSYAGFEVWLNGIWKPFYDKNEKEISNYDGFVQNKFYREGSCSTLVVCWHEEEHIHWIKYGDSALFLYDIEKDELRSWPSRVMDFTNNPHLINWKEETKEAAFEYGEFNTKNQLVFLASDALACYLLLAYKILKRIEDEDIQNLRQSSVAVNNQYIACTEAMKGDTCFYTNVLKPLVVHAEDEKSFSDYMKRLSHLGVILPDDYSFIYYEPDI